MQPVRKTQTGVGSTAPVPFSSMGEQFGVSIGCVVTGTVTYTVQYTYSDVQASGYNPATDTWFSHPDLTGKTANADGNFDFPVTASRLTVTAGTGSVLVTYIQTGIR